MRPATRSGRSRRPLRRALPWLLWSAVLLAVTAVLIPVRGEIDQAHVALIYLLVVLGGSVGGGRGLGFALACSCFLLIDYFLQQPYDRIAVDKPLDWLVLVAFLATAGVATQLLGHANAQADAARRRAAEVDQLAALGAEALSVGRAEETLAAIVEMIRGTTGAALCEIYAADGRPPALAASAPAEDHPELAADTAVEPRPDAGSSPVLALVAWVAEHRRAAVERSDGSVAKAEGPLPPESAEGVHALLLPLVAHGHAVGVLRLADSRPLDLDSERRRFLNAIAYYAALGVERVRLVAEAEHAQALREADRLKDALLASVSHDLRTPLTAIKALAHDIAEDGDERAAVIEQQSDRLNQMVADLLDLSRLNAGGIAMQAEINTAEDLVGAAIQQIEGALGGRRVRTAIDLAEPVPVGCFDFVHSLRILVNLIDNAAKYSPRETPIDIEVGRDGSMLTIAVLDRGRGVPPPERERIFEPFYRPAGVTPDARGSGLGLAIARRLAEAQAGSLTYADRAGGGSAFTLRLPAASLEALAER
ncbi:MAG TPA: ATP-binding protein [Thermoanaerobaculia bacterium]